MIILIFKEVKGDLFNVNTEKWVLAQCISADVTSTKKMNKGIAKTFRKKYPEMADNIASNLKIGKAVRYKKKNDVVYNLVTKENVWQKAKGDYKETYYTRLRDTLKDMKEKMIKNQEKFLAMPKIACGLDGGDWNIISKMIQDIFYNTEIKIQIRYIDEPIQIGNANYIVEQAKSNRSKCKACGDFIRKGNKRLKEIISTKKYVENRYYCIGCAERTFNDIKNRVNRIIEDLKK